MNAKVPQENCAVNLQNAVIDSTVSRQISKSLCLLGQIGEFDDELVQIIGSGDENNNLKAVESWVERQHVPDSRQSARERFDWLADQLQADISEFYSLVGA